MRRDELYLHDIVEAAESIDAFLAGRSRESFMQDDLLRSAVLHKLTVIGEAAARLSSEFREGHSDIVLAQIELSRATYMSDCCAGSSAVSPSFPAAARRS